MTLSLWLTVLVSSTAFGQAPEEPSTPPLPPPVAVPTEVPVANAPLPPEAYPAEPAPPPPATPAREYTYVERCFAYPSVNYVAPIIVVNSTPGGPAPVSRATSNTAASSSSSSGSLGGGSGKDILAIIAGVLVALPIVIYVIDSQAPAIVTQRFHCPSFSLEGHGGVLALGGATGTGFFGRASFGFSYFGADVLLDWAGVATQVAAHALLRIAPKRHVEGALALGYRYSLNTLGRDSRQGFEIGLPHRYIFWRDAMRTFGLEVRPMFMISAQGLDPSLEASFLVPIFELLHLKAGGRIFSIGSEIAWGVHGGIEFSW